MLMERYNSYHLLVPWQIAPDRLTCAPCLVSACHAHLALYTEYYWNWKQHCSMFLLQEPIMQDVDKD